MTTSRSLLSSAVIGLAAITAVMPAHAQQRRGAAAPRILVTTFQSSDRTLGVEAAMELRNRISRDVNQRDLFVVPEIDVNNTLTASGYSTTEALAPNDAKALATLVRAEEYVDGVATRAPSGVRLDARLVLARDNAITQLLPPAEAARLSDAASQLSRSVLEARRQIASERACAGALRAADPARAIRLAEEGLRQHTRYNNMIRVCLATAYVQRDTPKDSSSVVSAQTLALAEQVLASDPRNMPALRLAAVGYKAAGNTDRYIQTLTQLLAADPNDLSLQEQVVNELAASGRANLAVPIITDALRNNPGDPRMMRTGWLVLLAAQEYGQAIRVGEDMIRLDTALANADYFRRLAGAYSQLARRPNTVETEVARYRAAGIAVLQRATAKYPNNAALLGLYAQTLREAGRTTEAIDAARRAVSLEPQNEIARLQLIQTLIRANMADQAVAAIREASAAGINRTTLAQMALQLGQEAYRTAQRTQSRVDFERASNLIRLSLETSQSVEGQFLLGAAAFGLGDALVREAQQGRSCTASRDAQTAFNTAETNLNAARSQFPDPVGQMSGYLPQYRTALQQMVRAYCR